MKKDIHPEYLQTTIRCHCGHEFQASSTKENISVEICSQCHPFYTGKQKLVDSAGRIERFHRKYGKYMEGEKQEEKIEEKAEKKAEEKIAEKVEEKVEEEVEGKKEEVE